MQLWYPKVAFVTVHVFKWDIRWLLMPMCNSLRKHLLKKNIIITCSRFLFPYLHENLAAANALELATCVCASPCVSVLHRCKYK